jgi:glycosyltransferase involved in cell wall biosynthesis
MNSPKLIYLHQYFSIPKVAGGTRSWEFSTRLVRDGWEVRMISGDSEIHNIAQDEILKYFATEIGQFKLKPIPLKYSNNMSYSRRILAFLKFALTSSLEVLREPKANLTFATSTPLTIAIPALLRKWLCGTPYVFEVRDLWPELPIAVKAINSPIVIFLARQLERIAYHHAAHIVALSPGMKAGIIKQGIAPEKVEVIPNACDNDRFNVPESVGLEFLKQHPELSGGPLIVYTGTLGYINGVSYFAHLANQMQNLIPEAKFLVVGAGACENEVREISQELGILGKNFWMWESIPKAQMPGLLSASTVATSLFLPIPEMEHNSANKFFDGLAAGRPIAINYGGWQKEILENSGAGISIPGNDPQAGAIQLTQFLNSPERLQRARIAARKLADTEFDRDLLYKKLANVFQKVLNETSSNFEETEYLVSQKSRLPS